MQRQGDTSCARRHNKDANELQGVWVARLELRRISTTSRTFVATIGASIPFTCRHSFSRSRETVLISGCFSTPPYWCANSWNTTIRTYVRPAAASTFDGSKRRGSFFHAYRRQRSLVMRGARAMTPESVRRPQIQLLSNTGICTSLTGATRTRRDIHLRVRSNPSFAHVSAGPQASTCASVTRGPAADSARHVTANTSRKDKATMPVVLSAGLLRGLVNSPLYAPHPGRNE